MNATLGDVSFCPGNFGGGDHRVGIGNGGGGGGGTSIGPQPPPACVNVNKAQKLGIKIQATAAAFWNKTIGMELVGVLLPGGL